MYKSIFRFFFFFANGCKLCNCRILIQFKMYDISIVRGIYFALCSDLSFPVPHQYDQYGQHDGINVIFQRFSFAWKFVVP